MTAFPECTSRLGHLWYVRKKHGIPIGGIHCVRCDYQHFGPWHMHHKTPCPGFGTACERITP